MADKELRRLKRRELLQILLVQCEESERLQQELDETGERFAAMAESYERLKKKLDIKDERLNEKDAKIAELVREVEALKAEAEKSQETDSFTEAAKEIDAIFEEARQAARQYLKGVRQAEETPPFFENNRITDIRRKQTGTGPVRLVAGDFYG